MNAPGRSCGTRGRRSFVVACRFALVAALSVVAACALSPEELARVENHPYAGHTKAQVFAATVTALRSLGYEIVVADPGNGLIKSAPKVVTATAYATSNYTAVAVENSIAWTIGVQSIPGGAGLHADPRGYSGGQVIPVDRMNGAYLTRLFESLYTEIDGNLPRAR